jgi:alanine-alpha-ketoisovalerate/valine-pyruvate aminotransferase
MIVSLPSNPTGSVGTPEIYNRLIAFAREHPELHFLVTRIGCGIAGFADAEIAPLFAVARTVSNICLPESFQ